MQGLQSGLAPATWRKCESSPTSSCPVLLAHTDTPQCRLVEHIAIYFRISLPSHTLCALAPSFHSPLPSTISPFPVHVHFPHHHSGMPTLHSPKPSAHSHVHVAASQEPEETCGQVPTATSAPTSPFSPLPSPVPPPFTFLKCFEGVEVSSVSAKLGTQAISACWERHCLSAVLGCTCVPLPTNIHCALQQMNNLG